MRGIAVPTMVWSSAASSRVSIRPATVAYRARLGSPCAGCCSRWKAWASDIVGLLRDELTHRVVQDGQRLLDDWQVGWIDALDDGMQGFVVQAGDALEELSALWGRAHAQHTAVDRVLMAADEVVLDESIDERSDG